MGFEVDTSEPEAGFEEMSREQAMEGANRAFSASQEHLYDGGDEQDYTVFPIAQSGTPPQWDDRVGGAVFEYFHEAAYFLEVGTQTHEVVAEGDVLAFPWPEAPPDVRDMFEETFPTVFFPKTEPSGIDAIRFVDRGLDDAAAWWEGR
jgi:hypothetical protein